MSEVVHTIVLKDPIKQGTEVVSELKFQKAKAKHFQDLDLSKLTIKSFLTVAGSLTGQTSVTMGNLSPQDMMEVMGYVGKLFPSSLGTTDGLST